VLLFLLIWTQFGFVILDLLRVFVACPNNQRHPSQIVAQQHRLDMRRPSLLPACLYLLVICLIAGLITGDGLVPGTCADPSTRDMDSDGTGLNRMNPPIFDLNRLDRRQSTTTVKTSGAKFHQLAAGDNFTCVLLADGTLKVWPATAPQPPLDLQGVTRIAAGSGHIVVRQNNGRVRAFGDNDQGQASPPDWFAGAKDVAAGAKHSLVLFTDGTVRGFGRNAEGQLDVPTGMGEVRMVVAGQDHSVALLLDGTVRGGLDCCSSLVLQPLTRLVQAWGSNAHGQTTIPEVVLGLNESATTEARSVAAGNGFSAAALGDGSIIVWGLWNGQSRSFIRYYLGLTLGRPINPLQVVAGDAHISIRVTSPDGIFVLGDNTYAQTNTPRVLSFPQTPGLITSLTAGSRHNAALLSDGSLLLWGCKGWDFGQCRRPDPCAENNGGCDPLAICSAKLGVASCACRAGDIGDGKTCLRASSPTFKKVLAFANYTMVLMSDGKLKGWGKWASGMDFKIPDLGRRPVADIAGGPRHAVVLFSHGLVRSFGHMGNNIPVPADLSEVLDIAAGSGYSVGLLEGGVVRVWGLPRAQASPLNGLSGVIQVSTGHDHALVLFSNRTVQAFGLYEGDPSGKVTVPSNLTAAVMVAAGYDHSLVLQADGTVVAFGGDLYGQKQVPFGLAGVVQIAAGERRNVALLNTGRLEAWGANLQGQSKAVDESMASGVRYVSVGDAHAIALLNDGTAQMMCGNNDAGQCDMPDPCPEAKCAKEAHCQSRFGVAACVCKTGFKGDGKRCVVDPGARIEQVVAGFGSTAVRMMDGRVRAWGKFFTDVPLDLDDAAHLEAGPGYYVAVTRSGRLRAWGGRDGTAQMLLPVGLTGVKETSKTTALMESGQLVTWGNNAQDLAAPAWLSGGVVQISSSGIHTLVLLTDGSVKGWGNAILANIEGLRGVTMISASTTHNLAILEDGRVIAFGGYNFYGERNVPWDVSEVKQVEAGSGYSLVVLKDGTVRGWGLNATGQIAIPEGLDSVEHVAAGDRHAVALRTDGTIVAWGKDSEVPADLTPDEA